MADKKTAKKIEKKATDIVELRKKTVEELQKLLETGKKDLLAAQKSLKADELANPHAVKKLRREIARIKTVITEVENKSVEDKSNSDKKGVK